MALPWRVLIVGSSPENRQRLAHIVSNWQLETVGAETVEQAKQILHGQSISLVFCDESLPDGSFRDLLVVTNARRPRSSLVVMLPEGHDGQHYQDAIRQGAFDAVPAHYRPSDIRWLVFHAIRHAEETRRPERKIA